MVNPTAVTARLLRDVGPETRIFNGDTAPRRATKVHRDADSSDYLQSRRVGIHGRSAPRNTRKRLPYIAGVVAVVSHRDVKPSAAEDVPPSAVEALADAVTLPPRPVQPPLMPTEVVNAHKKPGASQATQSGVVTEVCNDIAELRIALRDDNGKGTETVRRVRAAVDWKKADKACRQGLPKLAFKLNRELALTLERSSRV